MFNKALDCELVLSSSVQKVKLSPEKSEKSRILSNGDFQLLYEASSDFLKPILKNAINTGMRRNEILNLKQR